MSHHLESIAAKISNLEKHHHVEIFRIIKKNEQNLSFSENSNGCFINMNDIKKETLDEIKTYLNFNQEKEKEHHEHLTMKNGIIESFQESI
jgi:hypothetical protein